MKRPAHPRGDADMNAFFRLLRDNARFLARLARRLPLAAAVAGGTTVAIGFWFRQRGFGGRTPASNLSMAALAGLIAGFGIWFGLRRLESHAAERASAAARRIGSFGRWFRLRRKEKEITAQAELWLRLRRLEENKGKNEETRKLVSQPGVAESDCRKKETPRLENRRSRP